jgi:DNA-binding Lrp family transcriptional regulator
VLQERAVMPRQHRAPRAAERPAGFDGTAPLWLHGAQGQWNRQVAQRITLSETTVRNHVERIHGKVGVSKRIGASLHALKNASARESRFRGRLQTGNEGRVNIVPLCPRPRRRPDWTARGKRLAWSLPWVGIWLTVVVDAQ